MTRRTGPQGDTLERAIGHYLAGSGTQAEGACRLELWTTATDIARKNGAESLAAVFELLCAEFIGSAWASRK